MKRSSIIVGVALVLLSFGFTYLNGEPWKAPKEADSIKNTQEATEVSIKNGKSIFKKYCVACHGNKGKGDGIAGASLNPAPANFWTKQFQSQTDGAIYWKLSEGRGAMAPYKGSLSEKERWDVVNYLRTFKQ